MNRTYKKIAADAYDEIIALGASHKTALTYFKAIASLSPSGDLLGDLARLGMQHCDDFHAHAEGIANRMDSEMEAIEKYAPQNGKVPNRGANSDGATASLAEFASGRQMAAAAQLGISQQALNTALKLKRQIRVSEMPDGGVRAVETKPFPNPGRRARK